MWKKAGTVVAASFAAVLAFAPLAHASPSPEDEEGAEQVISGDDAPQEGLLNLGDLNLLNGVNICPDLDLALGIGNVLGILGTGTANPTIDDGPLTCETSASKGH